jgi:hypothetical protein
MKKYFFDLIMITLISCFFVLLIRFFYRFDFEIIIIPRLHDVHTNNSEDVETKVKSEIQVDCYDGKNLNYCTFPNDHNDKIAVLYPMGKSMSPYFEGNKEMLICNYNFTLEENGIYSFNYSLSDIPVVHRCVKLTDFGCLFKGDYNYFNENITTNQIFCRVEYLIRKIE